MAERCDVLLVIGAPNSSNSVRLVEVAASARLRQAAAGRARRRHRLGLAGRRAAVGVTAGASAPEVLVEELIAACRERFDVTVEEVRTTDENVVFKLPRQLVA